MACLACRGIPWHAILLVFQAVPFGIYVADDLYRLFPYSRQVFLYRSPRENIRSIAKIYDRVLSTRLLFYVVGTNIPFLLPLANRILKISW